MNKIKKFVMLLVLICTVSCAIPVPEEEIFIETNIDTTHDIDGYSIYIDIDYRN